MKEKLNYIFDLDLKTRTYLRFFIETFVVFFIYIIWSINFDTDKSPTVIINIVNSLIWCGLYFSLGLHKDRLRYSSLRSYTPILKLSFLIGLLLVLESIFVFKSLNIVASVYTTLLILNFLVGLRVFVRELIRKNLEKVKKNILVYGVSDIAIDLVNAMTFSKKYKIVAFISDVPEKIYSLAGLPVIQLADVEYYKEKKMPVNLPPGATKSIVKHYINLMS